MTYPHPPQNAPPKRHGIRNGCLIGFGIVVLALVVIGAATAALSGGSKTSQPGHGTFTPAATQQTTPPPDSVFYTDVQSKFPALASAGKSQIVKLGETVCDKRAEGVSQRQLLNAVKVDASGIDVQFLVQTAETDICPSYLAPTMKTGPVATVSQQNALSSAQDYLSMQAFSKAGLIDQLSSKSGEGFPKADAVWAVNHLNVSWFAEAVKSARDYLSMQSFSRSGLIDQLSSPYGEQFTVAQATYAANKVGL
jgi:hypothetical protein